MTARDAAATRRVQFTDGISYAIRPRGDSAIIGRGTFESWITQVRSNDVI